MGSPVRFQVKQKVRWIIRGEPTTVFLTGDIADGEATYRPDGALECVKAESTLREGIVDFVDLDKIEILGIYSDEDSNSE